MVIATVARAALLGAYRTAPTRLSPGGELDEPYRCGLIRRTTSHRSGRIRARNPGTGTAPHLAAVMSGP
ncbi:hypothetical protein QFZ24_001104 [Streptomyces phaeochromogenes]|uniref:hypothetical protein n=1 Tax=Streptomyces phaeochromogenes TaxID=1923 RepID=UPI00278FF037|nr:hypothetical protein [Streptomyces phaeochromogenes]MDQ0947181.1 hypothetical protein [Streptomyces phaeochromogenes]